MNLRELVPLVLSVLVRREADFATAEHALQEDPRHPKAWLVTTAGPMRSGGSGRNPRKKCAHPSLTPSSAVELTLRAVGGLTTRQIAEAYLVPEATMAQRISRAKPTFGSPSALESPSSNRFSSTTTTKLAPKAGIPLASGEFSSQTMNFNPLLKCLLGLSLLTPAAAQPPTEAEQEQVLREIQRSYLEGNIPDTSHFETFLRRDLQAYFGGRPVTFEYLRHGPTQSGVSSPKYYFWVKIRDPRSKQLWNQGAVRVAAVARTHFEVTTFLSLKDLKLVPEQAAIEFPRPVADKILAMVKRL